MVTDPIFVFPVLQLVFEGSFGILEEQRVGAVCLLRSHIWWDGPYRGLHLHMLWMMLFLKGYPNGDTLSGICCATTKTVRYWVDAFLEQASNLKLVHKNSLTV